jgi:hypothetical protein
VKVYESRKLSRKSQIIRAIVSLLFSSVCGFLTVYLFSAQGWIIKNSDLNLSFLELPLLGYFSLRLLSRLTGLFLRNKMGLIFVYTLNGAAFAFFCYFTFNHAENLLSISFLNSFDKFFSILANCVPYILIIILGFTGMEVSHLYLAEGQSDFRFISAWAMSQIMVGTGIWRIMVGFSGFWRPLSKIGLIIFIAVFASAIASYGVYGIKARSRLISDFSGWLDHSASSIWMVAVLTTAYFAFGVSTPYAQLIEWVLVCFVAYLIFRAIKNGLDSQYIVEVVESTWQKHEMHVTDMIDRNFSQLNTLQQTFVQDSKKEWLLTYMDQLLKDNGMSDQDKNRLLNSLNNYSDKKVPWYSFGIWDRKILARNKRKRREVLESTITSLKTYANPMYQKKV